MRKMGAAFSGNLTLAAASLEAVAPDAWTADRLLETLRGVAESHGLKLGELMQPIRVALTGSTVSEPVNELLAIVGREASLRRINDTARRSAGGVGAA